VGGHEGLDKRAVGPGPGAADRRPALEAVRRAYPLTVEMVLAAAVVALWQLARVPFEVPADEAIAAARDLMSLERALGVMVEPDMVRWLAGYPALLDAANWFYSHMDETLVFAGLATLRLLDPVRYPAIRTAFVLTHVPALLAVAAYPAAPPRWVPGFPFGSPPAFDLGGDLRNSTAAAVSLHVGIPVLLAAAAIWVRPRSRLAWATVLFPALVLAVVVGTGNHLVIDAAIGAACAVAGAGGAALIHGRPARGRPQAGALGIAAAAVVWGALAFAASSVVVAAWG